MSRGLVFASGPRDRADELFEAIVAEFPRVSEWTVVHRELDGRDWRDAAERNGKGRRFAWLSDKPVGSKKAFLRELRREGHAVRVVWFSGDPRFDPAKIAGFLVRGPRGWAWNGREFRPLGWLFAARRLAETKQWRSSAWERMRGVAYGAYRATLGRALARPVLWVRRVLRGRR